MRLFLAFLFIVLSGLSSAESAILFEEDFENAPLNQPYPWNGSNNDDWYATAYNRAVPVSQFPEHNTSFLGMNVLYLSASESYHLLESQTLPVCFEYDFLFHYSGQGPDGFGDAFSQGIILDQPYRRWPTTGYSVQKGYTQPQTGEDGMYWGWWRNGESDRYRMAEIVPDTWYHVKRTIDPTQETETIYIKNHTTQNEISLAYDIGWSVVSVEGFTFTSHYSPSYSLVDNLVISAIPEPASLALLALGCLSYLKRRPCRE